MAIITGLTAERMIQIESESVVAGHVSPTGHLILTTHDGTTIDAGEVTGPEGDPGPKGDPGVKGDPGIQGPSGATIYVSTVAPSSPGSYNDGDMWLNTTNYNLYQKQGPLGWVLVGNIKGAKGDTGPAGPSYPAPTLIAAGTNLNSVTTTGPYIQTANANATLALNYPEAQSGLLEVFSAASGTQFTFQRYTVYNPSAPNVYERTNYNGTWGAWRIVMSTAVWSVVDVQQATVDTTATITTTAATIGNSIVLACKAGDKIRIDTVWDVTAGAGTFIGSILSNGANIPGGGEAHVAGSTTRATAAQSWLVDLTTDGTRTLTFRASTTSGTATLSGTHTRMIATLLRQV